MSVRKILVTNALPYANGSIHLGHILGYIQADIWVRAMRSMGHDVTYVCADDAHGTAIMLRAEKDGIRPEMHIAAMQKEHEADFAAFNIAFDHYDSTHSDTNKNRVQEIYIKNREAGHIDVRPVTQLFDPKKNLFLSDRFIKGTCPKCKTEDQYGDSCEACGTTYNATELLDPRSTLSDATPIHKSSDHYFFKLPHFEQYLQQWTRDAGRLPVSIANKLDEWFEAGLADWDISRDAPYFGFEIPDAPNKFFYVWVDAPVGYMSSFENYIQSKRPDLSFDDYWKKDSTAEVYHFIGKDIVYFHALFWPAMLEGAGYRTPTTLSVNGFLTVNGQKMSKSRGTFINASTYTANLNPEQLRYYFASKLSNKVEDSDLNLEDFSQKVNSDLVGKVVNIASRCAKFINSSFNDTLSAQCAEPELVTQFIDAGQSIIQAYEAREFSTAIRQIMALADQANQYIDEKKPWALAKIEGNEQQVHDVCSVGLNLFRQLAVYLAPVLPQLANDVQAFFNLEDFNFASRTQILVNHPICKFTPLMQRVDKKAIEQMIEQSKDSLTTAQEPAAPEKTKTKKAAVKDATPAQDVILIDDFSKINLRVGRVLAAQTVDGSDKLLQLTVDLGEAEPRQIFSGIRERYAPEALVQKLVVVVANLAPRKMRFGISNGMVLCAGQGKNLSIISPDEHAQLGDIVS